MAKHRVITMSVVGVGLVAVVAWALVAWQEGDGGPDRSCTRGGYETEATSEDRRLVVVRSELADRGNEIGRMRYSVCDRGSGRRVRLDDVSSFDGDVEATASFSILHDRWILERIDATGPTVEAHGGYVVLRDGRNGHWLSDNDSCAEPTTGVEVLTDGHLAVACDRLLLFTPDDGTTPDLAQEEPSYLTPAGADVRDLRVGDDGTTLRWTQIVDGRRVPAEHPVR